MDATANRRGNGRRGRRGAQLTTLWCRWHHDCDRVRPMRVLAVPTPGRMAGGLIDGSPAVLGLGGHRSMQDSTCASCPRACGTQAEDHADDGRRYACPWPGPVVGPSAALTCRAGRGMRSGGPSHPRHRRLCPGCCALCGQLGIFVCGASRWRDQPGSQGLGRGRDADAVCLVNL